jgi:aminoglycoside phosphotransferase (APT) family kinase protein
VRTVPDGAPVLGFGRGAVVYEIGDDVVLRRYREPHHDARGEALAMQVAAAAGVPVPAVHEVDGPDLVMERVSGPTMLSDLLVHPDRARQHAVTLAELHRTLDAVVVGPHDLAELRRLDPAAGDRELIHGDLHPDNVLLAESGPVLIDWSNYHVGPRSVDRALTWMVLGCFGTDRFPVSSQTAVQRNQMVDSFLAEIDRAAATPGLRRAARLRLADPATTASERRCIENLVRREAS